MAETALTIAKRNEQTLTHIVEGIKKLHEKVDALASAPRSGGGKKSAQPVWDWKGDVPSDYTGAVANYSSIKDDNGNKTGSYQLCVPVQLLEPDTAFAYADGKFIVPVEVSKKGVFLCAVDENTDLPKSFTGKFGKNEGLECVFVSDYFKVPRENPYKCPNAGTQPHDPIAHQIPEDITGEEW